MERFYSKFKLTKTQPYEHRHPILKEGNDVLLSCKANLWINSCIFKHKNKKCKIGHALDILNRNDFVAKDDLDLPSIRHESSSLRISGMAKR